MVTAEDLRVRPTTLTYLGPLCKRGHDYEGTGLSLRLCAGSYCIACQREHVAAYRASGADAERQVRADPFFRHCSGAKARSQQRGLDFSITPDSLREQWKVQDGRCYWLGVELLLTRLRRSELPPTKATLDRLDPAAGYVVGNVVWASAFANFGRGSATVEEFRAFLAVIGVGTEE